MSEALDDVFGWELLQLGTWGEKASLLAGCRTRRHAVIAHGRFKSSDADIGARLSQLPIANGAVDAVVLPHTLEFETDPYAVVREADRVLAGEGQLGVLGFESVQPLGFPQPCNQPRLSTGPQADAGGGPHCRLARTAGLRRHAHAQVSVHPALGRQRATAWSSLGAACAVAGSSPGPAGAYLIKARKRVYTLTPIRPKTRERPQTIGGLVKPTTHSEFVG